MLKNSLVFVCFFLHVTLYLFLVHMRTSSAHLHTRMSTAGQKLLPGCSTAFGSALRFPLATIPDHLYHHHRFYWLYYLLPIPTLDIKRAVQESSRACAKQHVVVRNIVREGSGRAVCVRNPRTAHARTVANV